MPGRQLKITAFMLTMLFLFDDGTASASRPGTSLRCDASLSASFKPDAQTRVVAVREIRKGEPIDPSRVATTAPDDLCLVKLMVGPGSPGMAGAPSTSEGIGIEIWLPRPARWNRRIHALGGGGWQGGDAGSATKIADVQAAVTAAKEGAVTSTTDTGHTFQGGAFGLKPDGTINETLWTDFASRGIHEQAVKTKALATAYYGEAPKYAYWEGGSTGGRQGLKLAQEYPDDFDGIIANYPAINWSRFITAELYPQIVIQRDLDGRPLTIAQLDLASNAATAACDVVGGQHLGYILDQTACTYDATHDPAILCASDGGANSTADCLTPRQAAAVNKFWFGMTSDGSAPVPSEDNGWRQFTRTGSSTSTHRWFGLARGTTLSLGLANPAFAFPIATDMVAIELRDPTLADPAFVNALAPDRARWKEMSYARLSEAYERGAALQRQFGFINTDNPDLSAFRRRGGKLLTWHGVADEVIMPQGTIRYYEQVAKHFGGMKRAQDFYRFYLVPGLGHGTPNGTANRSAVIPQFKPRQFYELLTRWVEQDVAPDTIVMSIESNGAQVTRPVCVYPKRIAYTRGDPRAASSYICR